MERIFLNLLNLSLTAAGLIAAILLLRPLFKKAPRWMCCALWGLVALRLLCPFSIESTLSIAPRTELVTEAIGYDRPAEEWIAPSVENASPIVTPIVPSTTPQTSPTPATPAPIVTKTPVQAAVTAATWAWLCGAVSLLLYGLSSTLRLRNRLRTAVREEENVWLSDRVAAPFVMGLFRPRIYLPFDLSNEERALVLAHERAHLARGDHFGKALGFFLLSMHWFNPLMWVAYSLLCRDMELACDERATKAMDDEARRAYSSALLNYTIRRPFIAAAPLAFGAVGTKERVKHVLKYKKPTIWIVALAVVACALLTIGFMTVPLSKAKSSNDGIPRFEVLEATNNEDVQITMTDIVKYNGSVRLRLRITGAKQWDAYVKDFDDKTDTLHRQKGERWVDCRTTDEHNTLYNWTPWHTVGNKELREDSGLFYIVDWEIDLCDYNLSKEGVYRFEADLSILSVENSEPLLIKTVPIAITFRFLGADTLIAPATDTGYYPTACLYWNEHNTEDEDDALAAAQQQLWHFLVDEFTIAGEAIESPSLVPHEATPEVLIDRDVYRGYRVLDNREDIGYRLYVDVDNYEMTDRLWLECVDENGVCQYVYELKPGNFYERSKLRMRFIQADRRAEMQQVS